MQRIEWANSLHFRCDDGFIGSRGSFGGEALDYFAQLEPAAEAVFVCGEIARAC